MLGHCEHPARAVDRNRKRFLAQNVPAGLQNLAGDRLVRYRGRTDDRGVEVRLAKQRRQQRVGFAADARGKFLGGGPIRIAYGDDGRSL